MNEIYLQNMQKSAGTPHFADVATGTANWHSARDTVMSLSLY